MSKYWQETTALPEGTKIQIVSYGKDFKNIIGNPVRSIRLTAEDFANLLANEMQGHFNDEYGVAEHETLNYVADIIGRYQRDELTASDFDYFDEDDFIAPTNQE